MHIDIRSLRARWGWASLLAVLSFAVMAWLDGVAKRQSGFGVLDLQFAGNAENARNVLEAWAGNNLTPAIGFSLGFDYLFMPLYGFALLYGAMAAREAFAPREGPFRGALGILLWAGPVAALLDAVENAIHAGMLFGWLSPALTAAQYPVTLGKWALVVVGLVMSLAGVAGLVSGRLRG